MEERTWREDWERRKSGFDCAICVDGRPVDNGYGVRYLSVEYADAYLEWVTPVPGYSTVFFRGRHVADPVDMSPAETALFWSAVTTAARAIQTVFNPCHLNYQILGNAVPHAHVHLVPRYVNDTAPERPLSGAAWHLATRIGSEAMREQVAAM